MPNECWSLCRYLRVETFRLDQPGNQARISVDIACGIQQHPLHIRFLQLAQAGAHQTIDCNPRQIACRPKTGSGGDMCTSLAGAAL